MIRPVIHLILHFLVPLLAARVVYKENWKKPFIIMMATMAVDLDHLLADPLYDPGRCSIGFHPLHTWPAVVVYFVMLYFPKTRLVGVGLLIHMLLDGIDCVWMRCLG